ncbi:hypothetical protein BEL04_22835 [Mucilaginibacter sp. PPCGB 2223]|uniref:hypothetical protein n=1 Tax=Mucilaginibacter sp. PPCGB 2223 TaxID=1886027 RepID=UPI000824A3AF|nr:hypothetical protein [Mucilaginibacter sp. PPCGB 2223]OCX50613.1 hypothetical protein BEL04_22835 [Mucilaginibacter sp. PPCGB 2223]
MTAATLILSDVLFAAASATIVATGDLKTYPVIFYPLLGVALATCIIRHINYYKLTKRIY